MSNEKEKEEKKKWLVERVQTLVESYIEKIELERARNKTHTDMVENSLSSRRSELLSGVAFVATVILALLAIPKLEGLRDELIVLLIADSFAGLVVFVVFSLVMNKAHKLILELNRWYFIASDKLADLNSLIIKETNRIDEIEEEKIYFYWGYLAFASLAVRVYLIDIFEDISKSIIFRKERGRWRRYRLQQKDGVVKAMDAYYTNPKSFLAVNRAKYITDIVKLNGYIEEFFKYDIKRKRALVVEPLDLDKLEKEINDKAETIRR